MFLQSIKSLFTRNMGIILKSRDQIEGIRESCYLAAETLDMITPFVKEGENTARLNQLIDEFIRDNDAIPATVGYRGYKYASCISLNEVVCHGVPHKDVVIKDGDILNIDVTTILDGFFGDNSRMYMVGNVSPEAKNLVDVSKKCLDIGIRQCYPGNFVGNIGYEIANYAEAQGYSVVYEFCGHGVGIRFHEDPDVAHIAEKDSGDIMRPGMTFTIEPMINEGKSRTKIDRKDGWTARTIDGKLSAQWEHTLLITKEGVEVLTDIHNEYPKPLKLI
ncbi:type I methionyl aminopeptidase [bacterium]|nr:type I methionyl aminopeptidase [bacterium]